MLARLIATVIDEVRRELRAMDPPAPEKPDPGQRYDMSSTTAAHIERAGVWDFDVRRPVGFGPPIGFEPRARDDECRD